MKRNHEQIAKRTLPSCKPAVVAALAATAFVFLLPLTILLPAGSQGTLEEISLLESAPPTADSSEQQSTASDTLDSSLSLTAELDGETQTMTLETYLWGVVAAEMPAAFQPAALEAQTIAARTYTLYRLNNPSKNHPNADICGDPGCCQAWISTQERLENWDSRYQQDYAQKITDALTNTDGLALYYDGQPILAAFHAASAGSTKSAKEVWGQDYPYLQAVDSPEDDSLVPNYYSTVSMDKEEFVETFSPVYPKADLSSKDCSDWFGEETFDDAGLPTAIEIGGITVETSSVRALFSLRSASFTVECEGDTITFYVTGYGHGVGMSQYGANALAKEGKTAEEILEWYYQGAELQPFTS
jgi:stage II sporulation protein D